MTGSNFFFATRQCLKSGSLRYQDGLAIAVKRSLKSVFSFFHSLSWLFQLAYFVQILANSPEVEAVQWPPTARNVKKKTFIKKGDAWANPGLACVLSDLFTPPLGDMISLMKYLLSRQLYFAYFAVFLTWVSCLTPKFGAHNRKMSLQKFSRKIKKG